MPKKNKRKAEFWWASIAGADPEPVEIIERDGRKGILTIGCPDPFWLDDAEPAIRLNATPMDRSMPVFTKEDFAVPRKPYLGSPKTHMWRGPR